MKFILKALLVFSISALNFKNINASAFADRSSTVIAQSRSNIAGEEARVLHAQSRINSLLADLARQQEQVSLTRSRIQRAAVTADFYNISLFAQDLSLINEAHERSEALFQEMEVEFEGMRTARLNIETDQARIRALLAEQAQVPSAPAPSSTIEALAVQEPEAIQDEPAQEPFVSAQLEAVEEPSAD